MRQMIAWLLVMCLVLCTPLSFAEENWEDDLMIEEEERRNSVPEDEF